MAAKLGFSAKKLNQISGMPQMGVAFSGWQSTLTLIRTIQSFNDGDRVVTETTTEFKGVIQPLSPEKLELKPEGLRSYPWFLIHVFTGQLDLDTEDLVEFSGVRYRIMGKSDYSRDNYVSYECVKAMQD